jgi:uncharacterized SAM-binding protein YcdF (DUF218 family)
LCLAAVLWLCSVPILRAAGSLLVDEQPLHAADALVVLAGDSLGNRILKAAELARAGLAPIVLVDNSGLDYGHAEADLAIDFATDHGYPPSMFLAATWTARSTVEEARNVIADLRNRGAHKAIVVTTVWHTARAGRIFRRLAPGIQFYMAGADDPDWQNGNWWTVREGRKLFLMETVKTIADYLRI